MNKNHVFTAVLAITWSLPIGAAEFQLRSECRVTGGLIRLGDIADVHAADSAEREKLAAIDLLPAPPLGERRTIRVRELQDLLSLRGMNLAEHRFSGASQVAVNAKAEAAAVEAPKQRTTALSIRKATDTATQAIVEYLQQQAADQDGWNVKLELSEAAANEVAAAKKLKVSGGSQPWTGPQQFTLKVTSSTGVTSLAVNTQVTLPSSVVVSTAAIAKGAIIRPGDVRIQAGKPVEGDVQVFTSLAEAIGKETTRAITTGQILDAKVIREPLLVRTGDIVTVYSRAAGVSVKVLARSRENGSRGELVRVESLADRKPYFARVSAAQEVEIFAQAPTVSSEPAAPMPQSKSKVDGNVQRANTVERIKPTQR